jgi:hypothetical protein
MQKLALGNIYTLYIAENIGDPPWSNPEAIDLAFTLLPVPDVATLSAFCVFLNWGRNMDKFMGGEPNHGAHVDAAFGLVHEFSGEPVAGDGLVTTPMQGVVTPGNIVRRGKGQMTLQCMDYNVAALPSSFGGTSGGGVWRMYANVASNGSYEEVQTRLCGVASFQPDATHIICQSFERINQALIPEIRKHFSA